MEVHFNRAELRDAVQYVSKLRGARDVVSRCVCIDIREKEARLITTDGFSYLSAVVSCASVGVTVPTLVVEKSALEVVTRGQADEVVIEVRSRGEMYVNVGKSSIYLQSYALDSRFYRFTLGVAIPIGVCSGEKILDMLEAISQHLSTRDLPELSHLIMLPTGAYVTSGVVTCRYTGRFPRAALRESDLPLLRVLVADNKDKDLEFIGYSKYLMIRVGQREVCLPRIMLDLSEQYKRQVADPDGASGIAVSVNELISVLNLILSLPELETKLELAFSGDEIQVGVKNHKGYASVFTVTASDAMMLGQVRGKYATKDLLAAAQVHRGSKGESRIFFESAGLLIQSEKVISRVSSQVK